MKFRALNPPPLPFPGAPAGRCHSLLAFLDASLVISKTLMEKTLPLPLQATRGPWRGEADVPLTAAPRPPQQLADRGGRSDCASALLALRKDVAGKRVGRLPRGLPERWPLGQEAGLRLQPGLNLAAEPCQ